MSLPGGDSELFSVDIESGVVRLNRPDRLDFERYQSLTARFRCVTSSSEDAAANLFLRDLHRSGISKTAARSELGLTNLVELRVNVIDEPEPPIWDEADHLELRFDLANVFCEHQLSASDVDLNDSLEYEIVGGNDAGLLTCEPRSGRLSLTESVGPESLRGAAWWSGRVTLRVSDSQGLSSDRTVDVRFDAPYVGTHRAIQWPAEAALADTPVSVEPASDCLRTGDPWQDAPIVAEVAADETSTSDTAVPLIGGDFPALRIAEPQTGPNRAVTNDSTAETLLPEPVAVAAGPVPSTVAKPEGVIEPDKIAQQAIMWTLVAFVIFVGTLVAATVLRRHRRLRRLGRDTDQDSDRDGAASLSDSNESIDVNAADFAAPLGDPGGVATASRRTKSIAPSTRSLREEMADLLAISQHFTDNQRAHQERRFHGHQFRLAAIVAAAAGGIALTQNLLGLDRAVDREDWVLFGCVCIVTAAASKAFIAVRRASARIRQPGPLSDEFKLA